MSGSLSGAWDWLTNTLGISGSPSMSGANFSGMADAGYTVPSGSASDYSNTTNPVNWSNIASSLKDLSKDTSGTGTGTGAGSDSVGNSATSQASSGIGHPSNPMSMSTLIEALKQRQQAYANPSSSGTPVKQARYLGLLGF